MAQFFANDGIVTLNNIVNPTGNSTSGRLNPVKFQRKTTTANIIPDNNVDVTSLSFSGLTSGRVYRISGSLISGGGNNDDLGLNFLSGTGGTGTVYGATGEVRGTSSGAEGVHLGINIVFVSVSNQLFTAGNAQTGTGQIDSGSFLTLEELPNYVLTTDFN